MALRGKWRELHANRFSELVDDCGGPACTVDDQALRDWSHKTTTPDQYRIEKYIDRFDLRDKRILHIGIGNSGLARRFHGRVGEIVGTSIDEPEIDVARALDLPNYRAVLHNKYSGPSDAISGRFDFIVDNNPTSPCCCVKHLSELLRFFDSKLAEGGQIVTDRVGLAWIPAGSNPRWSFDFEDFAAAASAADLDAWKIDRNTFVLCHGRPPKAELAPRLRSLIRRARNGATHILRKIAAGA